jgi:hypothetical protein
MLVFSFLTSEPKPSTSVQRNWSKYNKETPSQLYSMANWDLSSDSVQHYWNKFEVKVLQVVDAVVPLTTFNNNTYCKEGTPDYIKQKLNLRKIFI